MKVLTCEAVRRSLQAFHDRELPTEEEIAVWSHLDWCRRCTAALNDLQLVGTSLRGAIQCRVALSGEEAASFNAAVVSRVKAERDASWLALLQMMFEDMHLVYAGVGAAAAAMACVLIMLGMMRFATIERPDSLAAIVAFLASPGSNQNPMPVDGRVLLPRVLGQAFSTSPADADKGAELDTVFTLAAVVTREGRIANLELLRSSGGQKSASDARLVEAFIRNARSAWVEREGS